MKRLKDSEFELIVNKYSKLLITIANNYVRNGDDSLDIVQEVFIKLYNVNKHFESDGHLKNWLIRVTINQSLDILRRKKKELLVNDEYVNNIIDNSNSNKSNEDDNEIYNFICSLKDSYKSIIILYYYDNYNLKEIANILNISQTNAQSRLTRARDKLKQIILERRKTNGK